MDTNKIPIPTIIKKIENITPILHNKHLIGKMSIITMLTNMIVKHLENKQAIKSMRTDRNKCYTHEYYICNQTGRTKSRLVQTRSMGSHGMGDRNRM
jgi:hypothetical protein